jgi:uncharacterized ion transporter superfamily protein YfcC
MRRLAFPHPLTLLACCVLLAALLSHVLPMSAKYAVTLTTSDSSSPAERSTV